MDFLLDDSRDDKLIEDYLFSGYRLGSKSNSNKDQQFAKPIEDEDLFGIGDYNEDNNSLQNENVLTTENNQVNKDNQEEEEEDLPIGGESDILCERDMNSLDLFGGEINEQDVDLTNADKNGSSQSTSMNERSELDNIDNIFTDDYSLSPEPLSTRLQTDYSRMKSNEQQNYDKSSDNSRLKTNPQAPLTPAQIRMKQIKEKLLAKTREMSLKPRKLGTGFDEDGTIELTIEQDRLVSNSDSKFIFNKIFNKSKKASDNQKSPENNQKKSLIELNESLRKRICSQKRKIWDSFQNPVDDYDEEEEIVYLSGDEREHDVGEGNEKTNDVDPFEVEQEDDEGQEEQDDEEGEQEKYDEDEDEDEVVDEMEEEEVDEDEEEDEQEEEQEEEEEEEQEKEVCEAIRKKNAEIAEMEDEEDLFA